ncbi:elastase [Octopus bimaculoides]|uniref:Peptidase M4 domain-containing protein n=1 Tax=Octopus bimaculoides TaxID=37653 RepID=A0A0L8GCE6_OCTBM|nr:elastase [Octopus bimaculoides]|eukprot:XP_014782361.1 PREDICTED: elastase-like [Octopus bimaculoides]
MLYFRIYSWYYFELVVILMPRPVGRRLNRINVKEQLQYNYRLNKATALTDLFGLVPPNSFDVIDQFNTSQGLQILKLRQLYKDIPIYDGTLSVVIESNGELTGLASGFAIHGLSIYHHWDKLLSATLTKEEAFDITIISAGHGQFKKYIYNYNSHRKVYVDDFGDVSLIYEIDYLIYTDEVVKRPAFLISAHTGDILLQWSKLDTFADHLLTGHGGNEKSGTFVYSRDNRKIFVKRNQGNTCFLENQYVKVLNFSGRPTYRDTDNVVSYKCFDNFDDSVNGANSPARDALYYGSALFDMFLSWYGTKILRNKLIIGVYYDIDNAFWDGKQCNFGNGGEFSYPYTVADIIGHEVAHGFTEQHSCLLNFGQSGSMDESFSDITGETLEAYLGQNDWSIGNYITKSDHRGFRSLDDPSKDKLSVNHYDNYTESLDPHFGCGIYNKAFYYVVQDYRIPIKDAYHAFMLANRLYWHPTSDFSTGACDVMRAAYYIGLDVNPFRMAFQQVGVKTCILTNDIYLLNTNKTLSNIKVGDGKTPLFSYNPSFCISAITIQASSRNYSTLHIKITNPQDIVFHFEINKTDDATFYIKVSKPDLILNNTYFLIEGVNRIKLFGNLSIVHRIHIELVSKTKFALTDVTLNVSCKYKDHYNRQDHTDITK